MHLPRRISFRAAAHMGVYAAALVLAPACGAPEHLENNLDAERLDVDQSDDGQLRVARAALDTGIYTLHPQGSDKLCLEASRDSDGAKVVLGTCDGSKAQQWRRKNNLFITLNDRCLNVTGGSNRNGTRLQVWTCNERDINNSWTLDNDQLKWKKNPQLCVDVVDGALRDGTEMQLWACGAGRENGNQLFRCRAAAGASGGQSTGSVPTRNPLAARPAAVPAGDAKGNVARSSAGIGPSPVGLDVSPYFWTWAQWGDYPTRTLKEAMQKIDLKSATVSFELSKAAGDCHVAGNFGYMKDDIKAFRAAGNRVILSFGGATDRPPYLQKACGDAMSLANVIGTQIDMYDAHNLDFDIEGDNLGDTTSNNRLVDALIELQARYTDLYVSFTLPVDAYSGLPTSAVSILQRCIAKKVKVSRVNLMTMDYGQMPPAGKSSADMVLGSVAATVTQLKKLYPNASEADIYHMVGITPLIGQNDPPGSGSFYFTTSDARTVAAWSRQKGVGLLSYWGLMRDRSGWSSSNADHSNTPQKDFEFYSTFLTAK